MDEPKGRKPSNQSVQAERGVEEVELRQIETLLSNELPEGADCSRAASQSPRPQRRDEEIGKGMPVGETGKSGRRLQVCRKTKHSNPTGRESRHRRADVDLCSAYRMQGVVDY
jgi:hypothetical protein